MKVKVIGSSSEGNCYLFEASDGQILIVEAGVEFKAIEKGLGYKLQKVAGCIITHEHGDHAKSVSKLLDRYINVFASNGTAEALKEPRICPIACGIRQNIGSFEVIANNATHDAAEPFYYVIFHKEMGWVLFATDTTTINLPVQVPLSSLFIECNYDDDTLDEQLDNGNIDLNRRIRVRESHMSLTQCAKYIERISRTHTLGNVVLIHTSASNLDAQKALNTIGLTTAVTPVIATAERIIYINIVPF